MSLKETSGRRNKAMILSQETCLICSDGYLRDYRQTCGRIVYFLSIFVCIFLHLCVQRCFLFCKTFSITTRMKHYVLICNEAAIAQRGEGSNACHSRRNFAKANMGMSALQFSLFVVGLLITAIEMAFLQRCEKWELVKKKAGNVTISVALLKH